MYAINQTESERRRYWKELLFCVGVVLFLWSVSALLTHQSPTVPQITDGVFKNTHLTEEDRIYVLHALNRSIHADLTLLERPEAYRRHLEFLVSKVQ